MSLLFQLHRKNSIPTAQTCKYEQKESTDTSCDRDKRSTQKGIRLNYIHGIFCQSVKRYSIQQGCTASDSYCNGCIAQAYKLNKGNRPDQPCKQGLRKQLPILLLYPSLLFHISLCCHHCACNKRGFYPQKAQVLITKLYVHMNEWQKQCWVGVVILAAFIIRRQLQHVSGIWPIARPVQLLTLQHWIQYSHTGKGSTLSVPKQLSRHYALVLRCQNLSRNYTKLSLICRIMYCYVAWWRKESIILQLVTNYTPNTTRVEPILPRMHWFQCLQ